jgi:hypothetical protein
MFDDANRLMTDDELKAFEARLRTMGDREVIEAYEAATGTFDDPAMAAAADEMQRRHLDY